MSATSSRGFRTQLSILFLALTLFAAHAAEAPTPYIDTGKPVDWWFAVPEPQTWTYSVRPSFFVMSTNVPAKMRRPRSARSTG